VRVDKFKNILYDKMKFKMGVSAGTIPEECYPGKN
jgi:hypothetical protein